MNSSSPQTDRIVQKLKLARQRGLGSRENCHLQIEAPLSEQTVREFEEHHDIRLPESYRTFITQIGSEGAGPYVKILPLSEWDMAVNIDVPGDYLARPSPLIPPKTSESGWVLGVVNKDLELLMQGAIAVNHQGCTYYALLIVSGPGRGRIINICSDEADKVYFTDNPDFLSWYERWLDELIAGYDVGWFGFGATGTEESLVPFLTDTMVSPEQKKEAIRTLQRIQKLDASTIDALLICTEAEDDELRAAAAELLVERLGSGTQGLVQKFLADPSPKVRKYTLLALVRKKADVSAAVHQLVRDPDPEVVDEALLRGKGILTRAEIEPWLSNPDPYLRRTAVWALGGAPEHDAERLLSIAIHEEDQMVRVNAIQALRDLRSPEVAVRLVQLMVQCKDRLIRTNIFNALANIKNPDVVPILMRLSWDSDPCTRWDAVYALGELGDKRARPALKARLNDDVIPKWYENGVLTSEAGRSIAATAREALQRLR